jgi:REP element-mobilizing transposase RayT
MLLAMESDSRVERARHCALRHGRVSVPGQIYHVTATTQFRQRFFADFEAACAAARCFNQLHARGDAHLHAWVLMPDHAHWLMQLGSRRSLSDVIECMKSASARHANRVLGRRGALWARAFHDRALRADDDMAETARYIISNPVRAGIAPRVGQYPFWNSAWL